ncbi:hypothetical protein AB0L53_33525 [Nonomuraea sp. NPDC052129]|uniref:hypothetical protein n=1 Tax=Nonomuraea sp. NPDC052129 TaxID=3154651 RepID=UPI00343F237D
MADALQGEQLPVGRRQHHLRRNVRRLLQFGQICREDPTLAAASEDATESVPQTTFHRHNTDYEPIAEPEVLIANMRNGSYPPMPPGVVERPPEHPECGGKIDGVEPHGIPISPSDQPSRSRMPMNGTSPTPRLVTPNP